MSKPKSAANIIQSIQTLEGGGFPVRRPFPTQMLPYVDPFLLLDHMGPVDWKPKQAIGAPDHPHRGFETVTYLLEGAMQHKDSRGNKGNLNPGDVQWMTAGSGVVHSEMPEKSFYETGGRMNGFQIWVNLPKKDKMMNPRYQDIPSSKIPTAQSTDGKVKVKVIAGDSLGKSAVIDTRIPITYLHFTLQPGGLLEQSIPKEHNTILYVISGKGITGKDNQDSIQEGQMVLYGHDGDSVTISVPSSEKNSLDVLLLAGQPINEPVARYGPFVMNTKQEIEQAISDFQSGKLGAIR